MSRCFSPSFVRWSLLVAAGLFLTADANAFQKKVVTPTLMKPVLFISKFKASREGEKVLLDITVTHNSILRSDSPIPSNDGAPQAGSFTVQRWTGSEWDPDPVKTGQLLIKPNQNYSVRVEAQGAAKFRLRVVTNLTGREEYKEVTPPAPEYVIKFKRVDWREYTMRYARNDYPSPDSVKAENDLLRSLGFVTQYRKVRDRTINATQYFLRLEFKSPDPNVWLERRFGSLEEYAQFRDWLKTNQCEIGLDRFATTALSLKNGPKQTSTHFTRLPNGTVQTTKSTPKSNVGQIQTASVLASLNERVRMYCESMLGKQVGARGECWDLANEALGFCNAKQPGRNGYATYEFGKRVALKDLIPGDILQFENVVFKSANASSSFPHHTAVVKSVKGQTIELLHQNVNNVRRVQVGTINLSQLQPGGTLVAFRPQPR